LNQSAQKHVIIYTTQIFSISINKFRERLTVSTFILSWWSQCWASACYTTWFMELVTISELGCIPVWYSLSTIIYSTTETCY